MKKDLLLYTVIALLTASCQSNTSVLKTHPDTTIITPVSIAAKPQGNNLISFKIGGETVHTSGWTISRFSWSSNPEKQWLNITSNMHEDKRTINVNLSGALPGSYNFSEMGSIRTRSHGSYHPDYLNDLSNNYFFVSGTFNITAVDTLKRTVNGSFSGTVKNNQGEMLEITDGKIENGLLNIGVISY